MNEMLGNGGTILLGLALVGPAIIVLMVLSFSRVQRMRPRRKW